jgi:hypothetical protein
MMNVLFWTVCLNSVLCCLSGNHKRDLYTYLQAISLYIV